MGVTTSKIGEKTNNVKVFFGSFALPNVYHSCPVDILVWKRMTSMQKHNEPFE